MQMFTTKLFHYHSYRLALGLGKGGDHLVYAHMYITFSCLQSFCIEFDKFCTNYGIVSICDSIQLTVSCLLFISKVAAEMITNPRHSIT